MSEPLAVKLTDIEKLLVKLKKSKDHYHDKIKEYTVNLEETKTTLAKKEATLEKQTTRALKWSTTEVETNRKPEAILRDSKSNPGNGIAQFFSFWRFKVYTIKRVTCNLQLRFKFLIN
jgi:chromosome segregation ATPase